MSDVAESSAGWGTLSMSQTSQMTPVCTNVWASAKYAASAARPCRLERLMYDTGMIRLSSRLWAASARRRSSPRAMVAKSIFSMSLRERFCSSATVSDSSVSIWRIRRAMRLPILAYFLSSNTGSITQETRTLRPSDATKGVQRSTVPWGPGVSISSVFSRSAATATAAGSTRTASSPSLVMLVTSRTVMSPGRTWPRK
jgi:hypothetical protein